MKRSSLSRGTPLTRNAALERAGALQSRTPLQRGAQPARTGGIRWKPRRQPAKSPWPMSCTPELRAELIAEAKNLCGRCRRRFRERWLSVSRIVPGSAGGPYTAWNSHIACGDGTRGCHGWIEANPAAAEREVCQCGCGRPLRVAGEIRRGVFYGADDAYRGVVAQALAEALDAGGN